MRKKEVFLVLFLFFLFSVCIFRDYVFKNKVPFPANLLVSFYSPWKQYSWEGYPNGPPNKPFGFDDLRIFYPYRKFSIDQLKMGQWPLWNPYSFSGNVHLATYQSAVFYPLNFLYFVLPQIDAWSLLVFVQPILAGFFMYLFLRELGLSKGSSFFGSFAFAFSGWMIVWFQEDLVKEHTVLWLPLILYCIERVRKDISWKNLLLLSLATAFSILAGFLQLSIYVFALIIAWIAYRFWGIWKQEKKEMINIFVGLAFGVALSSVQILPAMQSYFLSLRGVTDARYLFESYLMKPWHLITLLAPDFWGNPAAYNFFGSGFYHEKMIYVGIPVLVLTLYTFFIKYKNRHLGFFRILLVVVLALGFFPFGWLLYWSKLPVISTMIPSRIFFLSTFGFCVLSAIGLEHFLSRDYQMQVLKKILLCLGLVLLGLWIFIVYEKFMIPKSSFGIISLRNLILPTLVLSSFSGIVLFGNLVKNRKTFFWPLILLTIFSSFYFANKYNYFSERRFVFPQVPVISKLKEIAPVDRVWGYGNAYWEKNMSTFYGIASPDGYDALFSQRYGELTAVQESGGLITNGVARCDAGIKQASEREGVLDNEYRARLLSLLGVRYILEANSGEGKEWLAEEKRFPRSDFLLAWEDQQFRIWDYKKSLPRVFLANDYLVESDKQKIVNAIFNKDLDLGKTVILEEEPELLIDENVISPQKVNLVEYSAQSIKVITDSSANSLLFISDNYYPGWEAKVDGQEAKLLRADYSFRALAIPSGKHQVILAYKPVIFYWSLRITVLGFILWFVWLWAIALKSK